MLESTLVFQSAELCSLSEPRVTRVASVLPTSFEDHVVFCGMRPQHDAALRRKLRPVPVGTFSYAEYRCHSVQATPGASGSTPSALARRSRLRGALRSTALRARREVAEELRPGLQHLAAVLARAPRGVAVALHVLRHLRVLARQAAAAHRLRRVPHGRSRLTESNCLDKPGWRTTAALPC